MGDLLMSELLKLSKNIVKQVRGKGLLCAIVIDSSMFLNVYNLFKNTKNLRIRCLENLLKVNGKWSFSQKYSY